MKKDCLIKELESNLNEQKEVNHRQLAEINLLNDRLNNEARRIKSLERESDRLRSEISLLESKVCSQFKIIANSYNNFFKDIIKYKIRSSDFFYIIEILSLFSATLLFSFLLDIAIYETNETSFICLIYLISLTLVLFPFTARSW